MFINSFDTPHLQIVNKISSGSEMHESQDDQNAFLWQAKFLILHFILFFLKLMNNKSKFTW